MRQNRMIKRMLYIAAAAMVVLAGCSNEITEPGARTDGKVRISFDTPAIIVEKASTRATLDPNTTVRVVAFTKANPTYTADQAYYVSSNGKLTPCTVKADGSFDAVDTKNELALYPDTYDLYAYTPALPLGINKNNVTVANGIDFATSVTTVTVLRDMTQTLTMLDRKCSKIKLVVKRDNGNTLMSALSVASGGVKINNLAPAVTTTSLNPTIAQATGAATLTIPQTAFNTVSATESSATTYLLPRLETDRMKIDYNLSYTIDGVTGGKEIKDVSGTMGNITLASGKSYTFTLTMRQAGASLAVSEWIDGGSQDVVTGESFDYSIDGSSGFMMAIGDTKKPNSEDVSMNWYIANGITDLTHNPTGLKACPVGWRLPNQKELMLLWVYNSAIPAKYSLVKTQYWSITEDNSNPSQSWSLFFSNGAAQSYLKTNDFMVRCIRDLARSSNYTQRVVVDGNRVIIDSRNVRSEGISSVKKASTTKWKDSSSPLTTGLDDIASQESNAQVYHYFEVSKNDLNGGTSYKWLDAINKCATLTDDGGGWRQPTQRELMLIWIFKTELQSKPGFSSFTANYCSSSEYATGSGWYLNFGNGYNNVTEKISSFRVRCIRDITPAN